ncbi:SDR family NAD(P)-dependent oxidoreductase [Limnohabitans sp.]|uniref:SDR family NAD(P)-dependent oxidoreductase n=1 Tax=Limnohabitans sp. TaxID=1907725 RepID=UPI0037BE673D
MRSLPEGYRALVVGATGAIGAALLQQLQADPRCAAVVGVSRQSSPGLDLLSEPSIQACAQALAGQGPFHLVLDATGALTLNGRGPEKRLDELEATHLLNALHLNAVGPGLLLKHFAPLLASGQRVIWGKLSARVGSIQDNRKGGWYGYRAAKAALNMLLQTAAIELSRRRPLMVVAALQPGTVQSALSQPFVGQDALHPDDAAARLLSVLDALQPTGRAQFVDHQGQCIPW